MVCFPVMLEQMQKYLQGEGDQSCCSDDLDLLWLNDCRGSGSQVTDPRNKFNAFCLYFRNPAGLHPLR